MAGEKNEDQEVDFLNMSDEDIAGFDPSAPAPADDSANADDTGTDAGAVVETDEDRAATAAAAAALDSDDVDQGGDDGKDNATGDVVDGAADAKGGADKAAATDKGKDTAVKTTDAKAEVGKDGDGKAKSGDEGAKDESAAVDYEAEYKKLMAPFKANGRDITPKSPEDAQALMQMGANYNKKMQALKPNLKMMKMLEQAGLLEESKLGYLIDLARHDPAAVNKLVQDSKIDPLDLSAEAATNYRPGNHTVDDKTMELDEVLNDLEGSEHYNRTLEVVSTKWDQASRAQAVQNPQVLTLLHSHMATGVYDVITKEMESERTFDRLKGLSDIDAYQKVGDAINSRGGFNHLFKGSSQGQGKSTPPAVIAAPKPSKAEEDKLRDKRRAASTTKAGTTTSAAKEDFNPFSMSDEDFAKFKPI